MIIEKTDSIFDSGATALVNPVNCVGVMGAGLAKAFKIKYPHMDSIYRHRCNQGNVVIGRMDCHTVDNGYIINFPTKDDWRTPSLISYILRGYGDLVDSVNQLNIDSVAIPALGCGLGGLEWSQVKPILYSLDEAIPTVKWYIYPPQS